MVISTLAHKSVSDASRQSKSVSHDLSKALEAVKTKILSHCWEKCLFDMLESLMRGLDKSLFAILHLSIKLRTLWAARAMLQKQIIAKC